MFPGEFYTIITNKSIDKHNQGPIVAIIKGTKADFIVEKFCEKISYKDRLKIKEVSLDFANNMDWIARQIAPQAELVGDRFHAQKFVSEAVSEVRIKYRWEAVEKENEAIKIARQEKIRYQAARFVNGDTEKQLLARSRGLLLSPSSRWSESQTERSQILFEEFPEIKKAYDLSMYFRNIFEHSKTKDEANIKLELWHEKIKKVDIKALVTASHSVKNHQGKILAYFSNRSSNAFAESFNSKIKQFRSNTRGISDKNFFLFRLFSFWASPKPFHLNFY